MTKFTAILEQSDDSTWSAYTIAPSLVVGAGESKEAALADLRSAMIFWLEYMRESGKPVPPISMEVVTFEVAA